MKMKKLVTGFTLLAFSVLVLTACGGNNSTKTSDSSSTAASSVASSSSEAKKTAGADLQDGTYTLEEKNFDENGWKVTFSITVADGKITKSTYDYLNADGEKKSEDADYQKQMKAKSGVGPADYIPELNQSLIDSQTADGVEVVTGATHSSESFKNYAQQLIQAAQAGNTAVIEIDNGADLKDGTYTLDEKNDSNGYHVTFSITVAGGKITESKFDNVNAAGESKADDADYNKNMKAKSGIGPKEYLAKFNEELVSKGDPSEIDVVTGATHSFHTFQTYAEQLINAAEKGNTATITVDNIVTE